MRGMRALIVLAIVLKAVVLGMWWHAGLAEARNEAPANAVPPVNEAGIPADLFTKTRGFREILEATKVRGADLDRREEALVTRERALKALEQALGGGAEGETVAVVPPTPGEEGAKPCAVAVTKIYASMKAEEAAPILEKLDDDTARGIFTCMNEKQIGAILAAMSRERAVAITQLLAEDI